MKVPWYTANPSLFEKEKREVEGAYPNLHFHVINGVVLIRGTFPIDFEGKVLDRYRIEIKLPRDYPKSVPIVREIGGRIPWVADFHMSPDGTACVFLPDERWWVWPDGSSLLQLLDGPVHNFFLGQSLVGQGEKWPFGQWSHGAEGIREFYSELLETDDIRVIVRLLEYLSKKKIKGHWPCPCGSGARLRECHGSMFRELSSKIPSQTALNSLRTFEERPRSSGPIHF